MLRKNLEMTVDYSIKNQDLREVLAILLELNWLKYGGDKVFEQEIGKKSGLTKVNKGFMWVIGFEMSVWLRSSWQEFLKMHMTIGKNEPK